MHEASLAQNIIDIIKNYNQSIRNRRVVSVSIKIGELMGIYPDSLRFYFSEVSKGTIADGAELIFEECPVNAICRQCKKHFGIMNFENNCPSCNSQNYDINGGSEFEITHMEVE